jgi:predicted small metal-binding protein
MGVTLACKDMGIDCPYVARGENTEELMADMGPHAKTVHKYTDEQLNSPEMKEQIKAKTKQE